MTPIPKTSELELKLQSSKGLEKAEALAQLGRTKVYTAYDEAFTMGQEALSLAQEHHDPKIESLAYNLLSDCKFSQGKYLDAVDLTKKALDIQTSLNNPEILVRSKTQLANNYLRMSQYEESMTFYQEVLKIYQDMKNDVGLAMILSNIVLVHKQLGNYRQAMEVSDKAIKLYRRLGHKIGEARSLANKGAILYEQGFHVESVRVHLKALSIREKLEDKEGMAQSLGCVGIGLNHQKKKQDEALDYLNRALTISNEMGDTYYITHYLTSIAGIYGDQAKFDDSLSYNLKALDYAREGGMVANEIQSLLSIASNYEKMGDYGESLVFAKEALEKGLSNGEKTQLLATCILLTNVYIKRGEKQLAKNTAQAGLDYASDHDPVSDVAEIHWLLYEIYKSEKNWESALSHLETSASLKQVYMEDQRDEKIAQLQSRYEAEKAQNEAELYRLKNVQLVKKNARIKKQRKALAESEKSYRELSEKLSDSNNMKELLLDIVTHDLKNPAGVVYSMGQMIKETYPQDEMLDLVISSSERLLSVLDHAKSLSMVSSDEEIVMSELHLRTIVQSVLSDFSSQLRAYEMEVHLDIPDDLIIQANPIVGEIFENYISNAIKYGGDGKEIRVKAKKEHDQVIVCVRDFGKTIDEKYRDTIFRRTSQLNENKGSGRGLGLAIVRKIATVHQGTCWVEPNHPQGNSFCVKLPLHKKAI